MKKFLTVKIVGRSKRIRLPKDTTINTGNLVLVEVIDENTITIKKIASDKIEWIKRFAGHRTKEFLHQGIDLSFEYL